MRCSSPRLTAPINSRPNVLLVDALITLLLPRVLRLMDVERDRDTAPGQNLFFFLLLDSFSPLSLFFPLVLTILSIRGRKARDFSERD